MYEHILHQVQRDIQAGSYLISVHAEEEMIEDQLTLWDMEAAVLSGTITERQRDRVSGEWKYLIAGLSITGQSIEVVAKLDPAFGTVIITVYTL